MQTHSTWKTMRAAVAPTKEPISKEKKKKDVTSAVPFL